MSNDAIDMVKDVSSKVFASVGSFTLGLEAVTDTALLSSVDNQVAMGILGIGFVVGGVYTGLSIVEDFVN
ncbi:hypothetical protein [Natronobeatus ordinarius]|uniref:hypothetical protein n=1 Tax=Natronobeatus ordinarius TaxID=2963433 RepID=UPI0020CE4F52|nr:hypothetical protein [Natronobeatus ordinarius]